MTEVQTFEGRQQALQARIDAMMRAEEAAPKPCPDLLIHLADLWNGADFAIEPAELDDIDREIADLHAAPEA